MRRNVFLQYRTVSFGIAAYSRQRSGRYRDGKTSTAESANLYGDVATAASILFCKLSFFAENRMRGGSETLLPPQTAGSVQNKKRVRAKICGDAQRSTVYRMAERLCFFAATSASAFATISSAVRR